MASRSAEVAPTEVPPCLLVFFASSASFTRSFVLLFPIETIVAQSIALASITTQQRPTLLFII